MIKIKEYNQEKFPGFLDKEIYIFPFLEGLKTRICSDEGIIHIADKEGEIFLTEKETVYSRIYIETINSFSLAHFFNNNPDLIIEGIWLYPQAEQNYDQKYLKKFYITDVIKEIKTFDRNLREEINLYIYLNYYNYKLILEKYHLNFVPLIERGKFIKKELEKIAKTETTFMQPGHFGKGIVIKSYNYCIKGKQTFASIKN